jgi:putative acetyltransferase
MIRPFGAEDLEDVQVAWEAASRVAHPFLSEAFLAQERRNIAELYMPRAETWVWDEAGRVLGFISLMGNEVGGIFVHADHQRKGIGQALMDQARSLRGTLELEVFEANPIGRAFYERYGFAFVERKMDEATGFPVHRLRLVADEGATA